MTTLLEELQPIALQVEEARTAVVDAAREWCREGKAGAEEALKEAVKGLDEIQMALGLKTAQLLLNPTPLREVKEHPLAEPLARQFQEEHGLLPPPAPPRPDTVGSAWTKRRTEE